MWPLPYRTGNYIPLWAAAYSGKTVRQLGSSTARRLKSNTKQPSKTTGNKTPESKVKNPKENQSTFINSLKKLSDLKTMELRHPKRNKNILLIKKARK